MINGVTQLVITKLDVLNTFEEIAVCKYYNYKGKQTEELPYDLQSEELQPVYQSILGWNSDLSDIDNFDNLPEQALEYIKHLESVVNVPVKYVSTGPARSALILRD